MKRIHLFEFEDKSWFPGFLRECMTRYLNLLHKLAGTDNFLAGILAKALKESGKSRIIDMCSGGGGTMPATVEKLRKEHGFTDLKVTLSDLYPNTLAAKKINGNGDPNFTYLTDPVDATNVAAKDEGLRTMVCSMHHMTPDMAKSILSDAVAKKQPIVIYEISDNSAPKFLWWTAIPFVFIMVLLLTPLIRPMTVQQLVFTYLIPILPLAIAWDGAVSNIRTYTLSDWDEILKDLPQEGYSWKKEAFKAKMGKNMYLMGMPN